MKIPAKYLSRPSIKLPKHKLDNDEVINRIKKNYKGDVKQFSQIKEMVAYVFKKCNSQYRYLEQDYSASIGNFAAKAGKDCMEKNSVSPNDIDLVINTSVAREYFEPSTAREVANKCGIKKAHILDVTSACAGQVEGIHVAISYLNMYPHYKNALIVSGELTREFVSYDIQTQEDLKTKSAGLTIGNAASAWLVSQKPFKNGCIKIESISNHSLTEYWELASTPIDGNFTSLSQELFALNVLVPPVWIELMNSIGWKVNDIDHFILHQPGDHMVKKVIQAMGVDLSKVMLTHSKYGNTASTSMSCAMYETLKQKDIKKGDKFLCSVPAAGFTILTLLGVWQ